MKNRYLGIDIGSVSLDAVVINKECGIEASWYYRTEGEPLLVLRDVLNNLNKSATSVQGLVITGSGREKASAIIGGTAMNEIIAQAHATAYFYPFAKTIIEIGGQDSKLIFLERDQDTGEVSIIDHALNEVCAAGTGSFLDQQANRLGIDIEKSFGELALQSKSPAAIAGRCSVFAKSDMIHLQQQGSTKSDIVAGLCYALARNFISNLGKGRPFKKPVVFQGGVAANPGVVKAFEELLDLKQGELIIPEHFLLMGAIGAALKAHKTNNQQEIVIFDLVSAIDLFFSKNNSQILPHLKQLSFPVNATHTLERFYNEHRLSQTRDAYLGIDVGAVSVNIVLLDRSGKLLTRRYAFTNGDPVRAVRSMLEETGNNIPGDIVVVGAGITGSGRYFIGDIVGADVVINEITAQAKGALSIDPELDTIIEIGGQDAKYISCENGRVVDFEMNKVCAAGTGSFLQEQAARLKVSVKDEFSNMAFMSQTPADLGTRCTVFMESDLIHHQQSGYSRSDLAAGLAYAVAHNYLEKVATGKKIGKKIAFLGGVAGNHSVAAAFEKILGLSIHVPEEHNVTGAIGAALAAKEGMEKSDNASRFRGFFISDLNYELSYFNCDGCPNICKIQKIAISGNQNSYYGGICGRYDKATSATTVNSPDLFSERRKCLTQYHKKTSAPKDIIGIPFALGFYDYLPFWSAFMQVLGYEVICSNPTNKRQVEQGLPFVPSETCYPVKAVYGHIVELINQGVKTILLPCEIDCGPANKDALRSFNCIYMQSIPYMARSSFGDINILTPVLYRTKNKQDQKKDLSDWAHSLKHGQKQIDLALDAAFAAQDNFYANCNNRGKDILGKLVGDEPQAIVLLGKPHNLFDPGLNLHIPQKFIKKGFTVIPYDLLPLASIKLPDHYQNVVWKNTQDLLRAIIIIRSDPRLIPVVITNFGCGPDSFFLKYIERELKGIPHLVLEMDDHIADAGIVTRIEAFIETIKPQEYKQSKNQTRLNLVIQGKHSNACDPLALDARLMKKLENRTVYFPYVSRAFSFPIIAALKSSGINAQCLPPPNDMTELLGRQVTSGRECHPFIVTCGEFVRMTRLPGFDPDRSAILMQNYDGACRFSQYAIGHAELMHKLDLDQVLVMGPLTSTRFDEFSGLLGLRFTMSLWKGWLATELLERLRLHVRPYEINAGEADRIYSNAVTAVCKAVELPALSMFYDHKLLDALKQGIKALTSVPVNSSLSRPVIGIVGEFYSVLNSWVNKDLIRTLESLGAEVKIHGLTVPNC
ncbi:MAG: acyl-CoA dehydratase activase, partial [Pseudomonadota bacterium]